MNVQSLAQRLQENVSRVIIGKEHEIKLVLTAMITRLTFSCSLWARFATCSTFIL